MNMTPPEDDNTIEGEYTVTNTGGELDTTAALAELSSDLFGRGEESGEEKSSVEQEEIPGGPTTVESPPAQTEGETPPAEGENSAEVQETGAPKTWSKEALETWATIPDRAKQEILKREEDMFRGLEQYRERAELGTQYDKVVEPYRAILTAENVNPVELFQNFAGNHYLLSRGTPEQKLEIFKNFAQFYGIDPLDMLPDPNAKQVDPEVAALQARIAQLESGVQQQSTAAIEAQRNQIAGTVEAFASDPANPYFAEVADDIAKLLQSGVVTTLQDAYDRAVWMNPATRGKETARLAAETKSKTEAETAARIAAANKAKGANIETQPKTRDGTIPVGTLDETLNETLAQIRSRA